jgi:hypothetical protein
MIDLRRGLARIGYALLALWAIACTAVLIFALFFRPPRNIFDQFDPGYITDTEAYLMIFGYMIGPPLAVFCLWRLSLWLLAGFRRA